MTNEFDELVADKIRWMERYAISELNNKMLIKAINHLISEGSEEGDRKARDYAISLLRELGESE